MPCQSQSTFAFTEISASQLLELRNLWFSIYFSNPEVQEEKIVNALNNAETIFLNEPNTKFELQLSFVDFEKYLFTVFVWLRGDGTGYSCSYVSLNG